ncbi:putative methyltransferase DDB_G0268948 [Oryza brachyantha]|uniref:putative methyltransferase DDB_G0268948 n=1 Tax=Oryza brachyantha TaxID=4533 RepID=UPI001ADAE18F|nr:putative methyltransferase DDB_G0268948 [Oryza brachyantha]
MANLFLKQAKQYAATRPAYPPELFDFIASKTARRDLAWDVGSGSGQAIPPLAKLYKEVVATDTSAQQLSYAPRLPNVRYVHTPPDLPLAGIHSAVAPPGSVDLVTVAQAFHWLDLPRFYEQVRSVLRAAAAPPGLRRAGAGVLAAWCYTEPCVDGGGAVDDAFWRLYSGSQPYWAPNRRLVDDRYAGVDFLFDPVDGETHTGPFEFSTERRMDLDDYLTYITSWSAYQTAKEKGVELLDEATVRGFAEAWGGDRAVVKTVRYPVFLRIGKVRPE